MPACGARGESFVFIVEISILLKTGKHGRKGTLQYAAQDRPQDGPEKLRIDPGSRPIALRSTWESDTRSGGLKSPLNAKSP